MNNKLLNEILEKIENLTTDDLTTLFELLVEEINARKQSL